MNPPSPSQHTPSHDAQVADSIVRQLVDEHLISESQANEIRLGLATGSIKATDWRWIAEKALELEARYGQSAR